MAAVVRGGRAGVAGGAIAAVRDDAALNQDVAVHQCRNEAPIVASIDDAAYGDISRGPAGSAQTGAGARDYAIAAGSQDVAVDRYCAGTRCVQAMQTYFPARWAVQDSVGVAARAMGV